MKTPRVMMIGLDGFDMDYAEQLISKGLMPNLSLLRDHSAILPLDHGSARRTGLAWEHISTGLSPDDAGRWAAVDFDPQTYKATQRTTTLPPFTQPLKSRVVVFDAPYFDLEQSPDVLGLVSWGAHDPGVARMARPDSLLEEIEQKFGPYPAEDWIYGFVWPSVERTEAMADALLRAVELRSSITQWLFSERFPDWQLGYIVVSECHSAMEALWHGCDPSHPLFVEPSARIAGPAVQAVYEAIDKLLGKMIDTFPGATFAIFNHHGMAANDSDVPSMALLPELLYRQSFGKKHRQDYTWISNEAGVPLINSGKSWTTEVTTRLEYQTYVQRFSARLKKVGRALVPRTRETLALDWMPAAHYERFWSRMDAFALPSFYDGRIRVNLRGRELNGRIDVTDYEAACSAIAHVLNECKTIEGKPVVREIECNRKPPLSLAPSEADMILVWDNAPLSFTHKEFGQIGPIPYRRTGGHTGGLGFAYFHGPDIPAGLHKERSAFDVLPTVLTLLGEGSSHVSGRAIEQIAMGQTTTVRKAV